MNGESPAPRDWRHWFWAIAVMAVTAAYRLYRLDEYSLMVDESNMTAFAKSVLVHGYPVLYSGSVPLNLATYELIPYFISPFIALFGATETPIRMHSFLFAVGTSYFVFSAASRWFCLRTGVIAGMMYAFTPWAIFWGQNAFHSQAQQFFAMLAIIEAVRLLRANPVPIRSYYLAGFYFSCSFLSWEGVGFLLPALLLVPLIQQWGDWRWLQNRHLWISCAIVAFVVVGQGVRRILMMPNYILVGNGRSEITGPELAFVQPYYLPYFYIDQFFLRYTQIALTIVFVLGLIFCRNWHFRFLALLTLTSIWCMTNLLSFYSNHYVYFAMPAFVIAIAAANVLFVDWLRQRVGAAVAAPGLGWAGNVVLAAVVGLQFATAGAYGLKTYGITPEAQTPPVTNYGTRLSPERLDYKGMAPEFQKRYVAGDHVFRMHPYSLHNYTSVHGDFSIQSWTYVKMVFDAQGDRSRYNDIYHGNPIVRSKREFDDVLFRNDRLWVVEPSELFTANASPDLRLQFQQRAIPKMETYHGKIYLYSK